MAYATETTRAVSGVSLGQRLAALRAEVGARIARYRLYRETYDELASLSDRELLDLGIARSSIGDLAWKAALKA